MQKFYGPWLISFLLSACGSIQWKNNPTSGENYDPKFSVLRDKILMPKCASCHLNFDNYDDVISYVKIGDPSESRLYKEVANWRMPQNAPHLSDYEVKTFYKWISAGAPNE